MTTSELTVQITATANDLAEQLQRVINKIAEAIREFLRPIVDWFNSPQVRRFFRHIAMAMRRAGLASRVPVRRRAVSTKRARIYQRKALLAH